jgi:putative ABC transport system permease protein
MSDRVTSNRSMFWRIVRRLITAHRGRLFVILLALSAGATITAALLNLQVDAKRRLTTEFRAFGANVLITPSDFASPSFGLSSTTLDASLYERIPKQNGYDLVGRASLLYGIARATAWREHDRTPDSSRAIDVVVMGYQIFAHNFSDILPSTESPDDSSRDAIFGLRGTGLLSCTFGEQVARQLGVHIQQAVELRLNGRAAICSVDGIRRFGGPEDSQVLLPLGDAQKLFDQNGRTSVLALNVPGSSASVQHYLSALRASLPDLDVRPVRQFTEAQSKIYNRISGLLNFTVALVLVLTGLCVMAAMTNVAMERRNDVGLMKAIGGARRRVLRLFIAEATLLGLAGGIIGAAAGIALSIFLGKAVFGLAARPRLIVYPISVVLTLIVAILGAFPLRRLASIRPASVFRGEA